jgi:hypothetical protein
VRTDRDRERERERERERDRRRRRRVASELTDVAAVMKTECAVEFESSPPACSCSVPSVAPN